MERLSLHDKVVVSVAEFYAATRQEPSNEYPLWMDPVTRQSKPASMTAAQVHAQLKEKAKQKWVPHHRRRLLNSYIGF